MTTTSNEAPKTLRVGPCETTQQLVTRLREEAAKVRSLQPEPGTSPFDGVVGALEVCANEIERLPICAIERVLSARTLNILTLAIRHLSGAPISTDQATRNLLDICRILIKETKRNEIATVNIAGLATAALILLGKLDWEGR